MAVKLVMFQPMSVFDIFDPASVVLQINKNLNKFFCNGFWRRNSLWVVILNAKGNEFPRTGITNLPHLFFYTTNHDKPQ